MDVNGRKQRERWIEKARCKNAESLRTSHKAQLVTRRLMRRSEYLILPRYKIQQGKNPAVASLVLQYKCTVSLSRKPFFSAAPSASNQGRPQKG